MPRRREQLEKNFAGAQAVGIITGKEECLACVNGEPYAYVSRSDVIDLVEAVNTIILN